MAEQKTNVMRVLNQKKIAYKSYEYPHGNTAVDGVTVARITGLAPEIVFKTLVCRGASKAVYVFCIPVAAELDLKKAATVAKEKSLSMIKSRDLLATTGYVHGGCSPIGMKKQFKTFADITAKNFAEILFSAGRIGVQIETSPANLEKVVRIVYANLTI